jgi:RNA polymerase sigma-70 factor, ECF subfamily
MIEGRAVTTTTATAETALDTDVSPERNPSTPGEQSPPRTASADAGGSGTGTAGGRLDRAEVAALIEREYFGLRMLISRRAGDPQLGADLLNEAVCMAWAKWQAGQVARPEQIAGYVFQVAMNLLRNHRRAIGSRPEKRASVRELETLPGRAEPRAETAEEQLAVHVKKLIRDMGSARDRTLLVRFYLDEEDKEVICRELRLSPLQFDKVLHRARRRLLQLLGTHGFKQSDFLSVLLAM